MKAIGGCALWILLFAIAFAVTGCFESNLP